MFSTIEPFKEATKRPSAKLSDERKLASLGHRYFFKRGSIDQDLHASFYLLEEIRNRDGSYSAVDTAFDLFNEARPSSDKGIKLSDHNLVYRDFMALYIQGFCAGSLKQALEENDQDILVHFKIILDSVFRYAQETASHRTNELSVRNCLEIFDASYKLKGIVDRALDIKGEHARLQLGVA